VLFSSPADLVSLFILSPLQHVYVGSDVLTNFCTIFFRTMYAPLRSIISVLSSISPSSLLSSWVCVSPFQLAEPVVYRESQPTSLSSYFSSPSSPPFSVAFQLLPPLFVFHSRSLPFVSSLTALSALQCLFTGGSLRKILLPSSERLRFLHPPCGIGTGPRFVLA
jgi:hypothetical protein